MIESLRKLTLTGFIFLIPQHLKFLRVVLALLLSATYLAVLQMIRPYRSMSSLIFAVVLHLSLFCTLFAALLVSFAEAESMLIDSSSSDSGGQQDRHFNDASRLGSIPSTTLLVGLTIGINFFAAFAIMAWMVKESRSERYSRLFRLRETGLLPELTLFEADDWHMFESHHW